MENELNNFYKSEKVLNSSQKKKLKKKQKEYQEQLQLDQQINSKLEVGLNEYNLLQEKLLEIGLRIHDIQADGNCLFKSIEHQLEFHKESGYEVKVHDHQQLRKLAIENILLNQSEYQSFLINSSNSDNNKEDNDKDLLENYCNKMLKDGEWGGEMELLSLSQGNYDSEVTLKVSYHQHQYILGAHYNSLIPIS